MPRKARFHPSVMGGGPDGGDETWNNEANGDEGHEDELQPPADDDRVSRMERELEALREDNRMLKRAIPPVEPHSDAPPVPEGIDTMSDEDFDALLFSNPREALRLNNERLKQDLRNEYTTNQGTNKFWEQFYQEHSDLKGDDDLVQSTLQKNMSELGDMPVEKAINRLAELTRERILGFMKKTRDGGRKRPMAEGANPPTIPARSDDSDDGEAEQDGTLGGLLRSRRARRAHAA